MNMLEGIFADYPVALWAGVGVTFLIVEILLPMGFFLSFAAAGFLTAAAAHLGLLPEGLLAKLIVFAAIGVVLIVPMRAVLRRYADRTPDINQY
jgi:membrane protein implicated in regulation of membrane protease activity